LSASGDVKAVTAASPSPGQVSVTILSHSNGGTASGNLLTTVATALNAEEVRPLTDQVTVQAATIQRYSVTATLTLRSGASSALVMTAAEQALQAYATTNFKLQATVALSGIYAALHQTAGVEKVNLSSPSADIICEVNAAPLIENITLLEPFVRSFIRRREFAFAADLLRYIAIFLYGGLYLDVSWKTMLQRPKVVLPQQTKL
ncbi:MAG: hypothetical protein GY718_19555, partial [Lentisphaerae bacterium]|nr:hypothetical protein [Lentisphaerota bacterium]